MTKNIRPWTLWWWKKNADSSNLSDAGEKLTESIIRKWKGWNEKGRINNEQSRTLFTRWRQERERRAKGTDQPTDWRDGKYRPSRISSSRRVQKERPEEQRGKWRKEAKVYLGKETDEHPRNKTVATLDQKKGKGGGRKYFWSKCGNNDTSLIPPAQFDANLMWKNTFLFLFWRKAASSCIRLQHSATLLFLLHLPVIWCPFFSPLLKTSKYLPL